jgi:23S rRNA G2445 N2-methylase RlmL
MIGNLRASGLTGKDLEKTIKVRTMDAVEYTPERIPEFLPGAPGDGGLFAFNPPYGHRMQGEQRDLPGFYRDLGRTLKRFDGWRAAVIVANEEFKSAFNVRPSMVKPTSASGLRAEFLVFDLGGRAAGRRR